MTDDEWNRGRVFDDWFDEPDTTDAASAGTETPALESQTPIGGHSAVDDWLDDAAAADTRRTAPLQLPPRGVVAVALLLIVLLLGVLAAAGVFSGSTRKSGASSSVSTPVANSSHATKPTVTRPRQVPTVPTAPLKPGDRGPAVRRLQRALAQVGYPTGTIDGVYGTATTQAVTHFQQAQRLPADGVAGPQTLAALRRAMQTG